VAVVAKLPLRTRAALTLQREVGRLSAVVWITSIVFAMRYLMRYRVKDAVELRRRFRAMMRENDQPVLICVNHLTMADSAVVAWALGGSWWYLFNYSRMPWNLPEYTNYASLWPSRFGAWITKCIPIRRGGNRKDVSGVIQRVQHLLARGETALIFPEAGRSRTGRVEFDSIAHGVGRIMNSVRDCQALCVYMRGDRQTTWSTVPARGDSFYVDFELFRPESEHSGLRRSKDLAEQIVARLSVMEQQYFTSR
jgi:1-acyl-sn-glycerol-3-phosphate acyltransferase